MDSFAHLHVHSEFSLLDGLPRVGVITRRVADQGMTAMALTTAAHLDGHYYKPRIDKELLARHSAGLIGTSACLGGEVLKKLAQGDERGAATAADEYRSILGDGNFFIEVQDHGIADQQRLHPQLVELARR